MTDYASLTPRELRALIRDGAFRRPTSGACSGYLQANMVIMDKALATQFEEFCRQNPQPCPLVGVLPPGEREPKTLAPGADIANDLPYYRVWRNGKLVDEPTSIENLWNENLVTFLIGCSFSFEKALMDAGVPVRNIEQNKNVSMYITNIDCKPVGPFSTKMVVSYRPIPKDLVQKAIDVTDACGFAHGRPIHVGDPAAIGISDLSKPDFGDAVKAAADDVPVFWACGVTSTLAAISGADFVITHKPGYMFVTDKIEKQ